MGTRGHPFFGELYLRSTRPFLREDVTQAEAAVLARLLARAPPGPVLDVGCGHGRHLRALAGKRTVLGLDLDVASVAEAARLAPCVRADFRALPFRPDSLSGAYVLYNSMFTLADDELRAALDGLVRCVRPGGVLVLQASGWRRMACSPAASFDGPLPDGSRLVEEVQYDAQARRDVVQRTLHTAEGRVMAASFSIGYYEPEEMTSLLERCGVEVFEVATSGGRPVAESLDYLVGAVRRG